VKDARTHASVTLSWAGHSEVGNHRADNEDSLVMASPVFAVADGMGGHSAGDVASDAVVRHLAEAKKSGFGTEELILSALRSSVLELAEKLEPEQRSAGTTVTGTVLTQSERSVDWSIFNIGDSRVYLRDEEGVRQITIDHSVVQQLVDAGHITKEEADYHPHSNVITRAVGLVEEPVPNFVEVPVAAGQRILICSDGLTKELTDAGIEHFMTTSATPEEAVSDLMKAALGNSGRDNVSIIVIDVHGVNEPVVTD